MGMMHSSSGRAGFYAGETLVEWIIDRTTNETWVHPKEDPAGVDGFDFSEHYRQDHDITTEFRRRDAAIPEGFTRRFGPQPLVRWILNRTTMLAWLETEQATYPEGDEVEFEMRAHHSVPDGFIRGPHSPDPAPKHGPYLEDDAAIAASPRSG